MSSDSPRPEGRRMRPVTRDEADGWLALARQYGVVDDQGGFAFGRYVLERVDTHRWTVRFITPVPAGLYTADLRPKVPPIQFDRTPAGEIILPGRWLQTTFEHLSEDPTAPPDVRRAADVVARTVGISDCLLPADQETILIGAPDERGAVIPHEALPPGTSVELTLTPRGDDSAETR